MTVDLAKYIDHTQLNADTTKEQIDKLIEEARIYQFASICINPSWIGYCYERLKDSSVKVCTVIGFPLGASSTETKVFETRQAIKDGATEVDMVIPVGALKSGNTEVVLEDIKAVVDTAKGKALTKVIIETALLTEDEKVKACQLAKKAGADFVKTSTGFSIGGATINDVKLMKDTVGSEMGVKASGGIRDLQTMKEMIAAGATRIGASAGVQILSSADNS